MNHMEMIKRIITGGAASAMTEPQFLAEELIKWRSSSKRKDMLTGAKYYAGTHDILLRKRTAIGQGGCLHEVGNLPNNRVVDNQYALMVDQKSNYLLGKPLTIDCENEEYKKALMGVFNKRFQRLLKNVCEDSLNGGIAWLHPYYSEQGELCFKRFESYEILPFWSDSEHTVLDCAVRLYEADVYDGRLSKTVEKVELFTMDGIERYILQGGALIPDIEVPSGAYMTATAADGTQTGYNWGRIPLVPFKYNNRELPLINRVKSLQDAINITVSDFLNGLQEDVRNTILVVKNYGGTDLAEFRHNLSVYGAIKIDTADGTEGGVETLKIEMNADNYKTVLYLLKRALVENARGCSAKDDRMSGNPNQMNIQSMYSDLDLDANGMETEYQASFEQLLWFINAHLENTGAGSFDGESVNIIFNRDILINETEAIENCQKSAGILSPESIVSQHPWTSDLGREMRRLEANRGQNFLVKK